LNEKDGPPHAISFLHAGSGEAPLVLRAAKGAQVGAAALARPLTTQRSWESRRWEDEQERLSERGRASGSSIVYFCSSRKTHAFRL